MCGIAGVVSPDPGARSLEVIGRMAAAVAHRGPDDEGIQYRDGATLAVRRLAIIDLTGGHQPMSDEAGNVWAIQNGEIYNFEELRDELAALGHHFRTRNDTEVLPHAYEEWGPDLVAKLRGMFAIALWDDRRGRLLLARDRFGKKPLVYARLGGTFLFASEIQALLAHPALDREIDESAIADYLTFGYVPAPRTGFAKIRKVPAGHLVLYDGDREEMRRYWYLSFVPKLEIGLEDAVAETRRLMDDAVRVRLISDVPLGAFLSGGLDSSTVVAFMAKHSARPVKTFTIGFREQQFDESRYARIVARTFATDHREFVVDADQTADLPLIARHLGEPFADSSIVPSYHVARVTRSHVTVALNGDGGDELFGGYDRYRGALLAGQTSALLPEFAGSTVRSVAKLIPLATFVPRPLARARRFLTEIGRPAGEQQVAWTGFFTGAIRLSVLGERLVQLDGERRSRALEEAAALSGATDPAERFMAGDILTTLPGDLLVKMDIATMAHSLEARSPLLDHRLAEFVARLPRSYKLTARTSKIVLRRAMAGILPPEILGRGKMGFGVPVGQWLRGPLRPMLEGLVLSQTAAERGFVSASGARWLVEEHLSGKAERPALLWNLLMLELWFRECVDRASPRSSVRAGTV